MNNCDKKNKVHREKNVNILDTLFWSVQPKLGITKGTYYRAENKFAPHFPGDEGYRGILEVVEQNGKIVMVEFNEINSPTYYIRRYQNVSKRLSDYSFFQATKERTAKTKVVLVNGLTHLEKQMINENRLTGEFDLLTGASNSIKRSMLKLADEINESRKNESEYMYYGIAEEVEKGVTGRLQVVLREKKIISIFYDEIFADNKEEIANEELKSYYRQSKYHSLDYISNSGIGFNSMVDLLKEKVLRNQNLIDLSGLPYTEGERIATEWNNYLMLAKKLLNEMQKDYVI